MSFCLVGGGDEDREAKVGSPPAIMFSTDGALQPPAGLNQIPPSLIPTMVSKAEFKL